jgi:outer membrane protein assembly factor BamB
MTWFTRWSGLVLATALTGCAMAPSAPEPSALQAFEPVLSVSPAWQAQLGAGSSELRMGVAGQAIALASEAGLVQVRQAKSGAMLWSVQLSAQVAAGVGFDGERVALVDQQNRLTVMAQGKVLWQVTLAASTYTPPLVAGGRVFVLSAEREVLAFDGRNGAKLWSLPYVGEPLVLRSAGLLGAYDNNLLVGLGERLVAIEPDTGKAFWSVALTLPRGVNEIERLIDVVAGAHAANGLLCARTFQASVGCVSAPKSVRVWSQDSDGVAGVTGDNTRLVSADRSGRVQAWALNDGKPLWTQDALRFRGVSTPVMLGLSLVVGDAQGYVHWLSKDDGRVLNRFPTDGSAITAPPVLVDGTLIAMTTQGGVFAWQPR